MLVLVVAAAAAVAAAAVLLCIDQVLPVMKACRSP